MNPENKLTFAHLRYRNFFCDFSVSPALDTLTQSLCLLKILAKDRMARKKVILVSTFLRNLVRTFGLDFQ
jgi:hypothetical protein